MFAVSVGLACTCMCVCSEHDANIPLCPPLFIADIWRLSCALEQTCRSWLTMTGSLQAFGAAVKTGWCVPLSDSKPKNVYQAVTLEDMESVCAPSSPPLTVVEHRQVKVQSGCLLKISRHSGQPKTITGTSRELLILLLNLHPLLFIAF